MKHVLKNKKKAFTLSEVLITLVVLGVISAITVPTLFTMYQQNVTIEKLKKVHSTLAQVSNRIVADEGGTFADLHSDFNAKNILELFSLGTYQGMCKFAMDHFFPYLSITETKEFSLPVCERGKCFNVAPELQLAGIHLVDGTTMAVLPMDIARNHCYTIRICSGEGCSENFPASFCGIPILVDINGESKPNRLGRDMFVWEYRINDEKNPNYVSKFLPLGYGNNDDDLEEMFGTSECSKEVPLLCAKKIMDDGWKIKKDYPW